MMRRSVTNLFGTLGECHEPRVPQKFVTEPSSYMCVYAKHSPSLVAEAEAVNNNREIAREYGISESMVRKWRN